MAVNDKLTKTPYKTEKYTEQQLIELAKCASDQSTLCACFVYPSINKRLHEI